MSQFISQIQAQIQQLQVMLNNTSLPAQVRQQAQLKHQQLQVELQQAQLTVSSILRSLVECCVRDQDVSFLSLRLDSVEDDILVKGGE